VAEAELVVCHLLVSRVCFGIEANLCANRVCQPICFPQLAVEEVVLIAFLEMSFASLLVVFRLGVARSPETTFVD